MNRRNFLTASAVAAVSSMVPAPVCSPAPDELLVRALQVEIDLMVQQMSKNLGLYMWGSGSMCSALEGEDDS